MECTKCKLQYVGKAETELNRRINNHRKYVYKLNEMQQIDISHKEIVILTLTQSLLSLQNSKTQS